MEFKSVISARRSTRKFLDRPVATELLDRLLDAALTAPSARNTRSTSFLVVTDHSKIERMAAMRDYGSAFMSGARAVIVVLGTPARSDLWRENAAIAATLLQLAAVDEGLASCWVHINDRPRLKSEPEGARAIDYLREFLPIPPDAEALCAIALGYSDFTPAPLPAFDRAEHIVWDN